MIPTDMCVVCLLLFESGELTATCSSCHLRTHIECAKGHKGRCLTPWCAGRLLVTPAGNVEVSVYGRSDEVAGVLEQVIANLGIQIRKRPLPTENSIKVDETEPDIDLTKEYRSSLHQSLLSAFPDKASLSRMVDFGLDVNISQITKDTTLSDAVHELIVWAIAQGKIKMLLTAAINSNPGNYALREFARQLWLVN